MEENTKVVSKGKNKRTLIMIIAVLVVAVVGVVYGLSTGKVLKPTDKILLASYNTYEESIGIHKEFEKLKDFDQNKLRMNYSLGFNAEGQDIAVDFVFNQDLKAKKLQGYVNMNMAEIAIPNVYFDMNDKKLSVYSPELFDAKFSYNYMDSEVSDYVKSLLSVLEVQGIPADIISLVDTSLASYWDMASTSTDLNKLMMEVLKNEFKSLEIKELDEKVSLKYKENVVEAENFEFIFTSENMKNIMTEIDSLYAKYVDVEAARAMFEKMGMSPLEIEQALNPYSALKDSPELENMKDVTVNVYLANNELVGVNFQNEDGKVEILLLGKDINTNLITFSSDSKETEKKTVAFITSQDGDVIKTVLVEDEEKGDFTYDTKSGKFTLYDKADLAGIEGKLLFDKAKLEISLDKIVGDDSTTEAFDFHFVMDNEVEFEDEAEMTEYELKKLTEEDVKSIQMIIFSIMMQYAY